MNRHRRGGIYILFFTYCLLILISCGGGGGGSLPEPTPVSDINSTNAGAIAGNIVTTIGLITEPTYVGKTTGEDRTIAENKAFIQTILRESLRQIKAGSRDETRQCLGGGSRREISQWSGPNDNPENYTGQITYTNCIEGLSNWNGSKSLRYEGSLNKPTKVTTELTNMRYINTGVGTNIVMSSLTIVYSDLVYNASDEVVSAKVVMNGRIEGTVNNKGINAGYNNYTMQYSISGSRVMMSMSGKITTGCISRELTVQTTQQMELGIGSRCPTAGQMTVSDGIAEVKMVFGSQGAMEVYLNNQRLNTFSPCTDSEGRCS